MNQDAMNPFAGTLAELTWGEVEEAIEGGAIGLWAIGVIEQHGPHLPAGTDVYVPTAHLLEAKAVLAREGITSLLIPPFYWGVNQVSSAFPASYGLSPDLMEAVIAELLTSFSRDGFSHIFCLSGHGDAAHNMALHAGVVRARSGGVTTAFHHLLPEQLASRLAISSDDPAAVVMPTPTEPPSPQGNHPDVHAGDWETSIVLAAAPDLVHDDYVRLRDTALGPEDLLTWRRGGQHARAVTPLGYFGDPASATPGRGEQWRGLSATGIVTAIGETLSKGW